MNVGVFAANGIGDALIMSICAHQFGGTLFTDCADLVKHWFPFPVKPWPKTFDDFDLLILENDNSKRAWDLMQERDHLPPMRVIFPTINPKLDVRPEDFVCNRHLSITHNVSMACGLWLDSEISLESGFLHVEPERQRIVEKRVAIHPTSRDPKRNWSKHGFIALAKALSWRGFFPAFVVAPDERNEWKEAENLGFAVPHLNGGKELAQFLGESGYFIGNDSGMGHLASIQGVPTLTISGNPKRVQLWRPGFADNAVVTLKIPLPNCKGLKLREHLWQPFISVARVLKEFEWLRQQ